MKKYLFLIALGVLLVALAGCKQPEEPDKAAEALVESFIYQEPAPELKTIFGMNDEQIKQENQNIFLSSIQEKIKYEKKEKLLQLYQKAQTHLKKVTTYKIAVKESNKKEATVAITIKGLDINHAKVQKRIAAITHTAQNKVKADSSDKELAKIIDQASLNSLAAVYLDSPAKEKATTVTLHLQQDPDNKERWKIKKENAFFQDLYEAFGL